MNLKALAAVTGTVVALSAGSAFAWDLHDTLAPAPNPTPTTSQRASTGSDLQIPGSGSVTVRGAAYDFKCSEAKSRFAPGSFEIATFCAPEDR